MNKDTKRLKEYPLSGLLLTKIPADTYKLTNPMQLGALQLHCDSHNVTPDRIIRVYYDTICDCLMVKFPWGTIGIETDGYCHS